MKHKYIEIKRERERGREREEEAKKDYTTGIQSKLWILTYLVR